MADTATPVKPYLVCIVDSAEARHFVAEVEPLVADRVRMVVHPSVTVGVKHLETSKANNEKVAAVLTEDPLAGMAGGGLWCLQKCRALYPDAMRLLGLQPSVGPFRLGFDKMKDADVQALFELAMSPSEFAQTVLGPLLVPLEQAFDETLRAATVRTVTDALVLKIPKEVFTDLLVHDARLSIGITRELARRLRRQQQ